MLKYIILCSLLLFADAYNLCIVGGSSGLGKELIYQGITEKNLDILALTSQKNKITTPCRVDSFNEIRNQPEFNHPKLKIDNYWNDLKNYKYDHLVLTTSAKPFEDDYSDILMKNVIENLPNNCKTISLISAFGVGESLKKGNIGIAVMNAWYLKDVYRAKNEQELILNNIKNKNIKKFIYRPKALSYGKTTLDSTSRKELAKEILSKVI